MEFPREIRLRLVGAGYLAGGCWVVFVLLPIMTPPVGVQTEAKTRPCASGWPRPPVRYRRLKSSSPSDVHITAFNSFSVQRPV